MGSTIVAQILLFAETHHKNWTLLWINHGVIVYSQREPPLVGAISVLAAARHQPRRVVPLGRGGLRQGAEREQAHLPLRRLLHVPLVPRHGEGVLCEH